MNSVAILFGIALLGSDDAMQAKSTITDGAVDVRLTYRSMTQWVFRIDLIDPDGKALPAWRVENWEERIASSGPGFSFGLGGRRTGEEGARGGGPRFGTGRPTKTTIVSHAQGTVTVSNLAYYRRTSGKWRLRVVLIDKAGKTSEKTISAPAESTDLKREAGHFARNMFGRISSRGRREGDPARVTPGQIEAWVAAAPDRGPTRGLAAWYAANVRTAEEKALFRGEFVRGISKEKERRVDLFVVQRVTGSVAARPPGSSRWRRVTPGMALPPGSVIQTGLDSSVELKESGGHEIYIPSGSGVTLTSGPAPGVDIHYGGVRIRAVRSVRRTDLRVSTPNASGGVSGTKVEIVYDSARDETTATVYDGSFDVRHRYTGETQALSKMRAVLRPNGMQVTPAPSLPRGWWPGE